MLSMSREILDYARGEISLALSTVNVWDFLQQLVDTYQPTFRQAGIGLSFTWRQDTEASPETELDPDRMRRALMNLIGNAKEAIKGEGQIRLRSWTTTEDICIEIQDDGPGIPATIENDIFNAFVTHGKSGGTGLGLAITKKIVESHQGTISFSSEPGVGTTFTITLPRKQASRIAVSQEAAQSFVH
jgi:signal transduction histidine kinase